MSFCPTLCFAILLGMAFLFSAKPTQSLYGAAAALMLLMIVGIHNAWDIAVWNSVKKQDEKSPSDQ